LFIRLRTLVTHFWIAGAAAALAGPACAQSQAAVDVFVSQLDDTMHELHDKARGNAARIRAGCRDVVGRFLNLEAMAKAAGEDIWDKMSVAQRETYRTAFGDRMVAECGRQFADYRGEDVRELGTRSLSGGDKLVMTRVGRGEDAKMVGWRMHGGDASAAVDVIWEGNSAVAKARSEFAAVLQGANGNVDALIGFMRK
jgi:ABC-type transporter MlaC component